MGSNCTKPSSNSVTNPQESFENNNPISDIHQIIAQESFLDEILYINIKYKDFFSIISFKNLKEMI